FWRDASGRSRANVRSPTSYVLRLASVRWHGRSASSAAVGPCVGFGGRPMCNLPHGYGRWTVTVTPTVTPQVVQWNRCNGRYGLTGTNTKVLGIAVSIEPYMEV